MGAGETGAPQKLTNGLFAKGEKMLWEVPRWNEAMVSRIDIGVIVRFENELAMGLEFFSNHFKIANRFEKAAGQVRKKD